MIHWKKHYDPCETASCDVIQFSKKNQGLKTEILNYKMQAIFGIFSRANGSARGRFAILIIAQRDLWIWAGCKWVFLTWHPRDGKICLFF